MIAETRSSEPIERISKIFRNGATKLWLRKNIEQSTDEDGADVYTALETMLVLDGDYDISDISDDEFEELWSEAMETPIDVNAFIEVVPTLLMTANLSDEDAVRFKSLYPRFKPGNSYKKDMIVRYNDELYRIGQDLGPEQMNVYKPGDEGTTALYSKISIGEDGYEVWKEWDGVSGSYKQDQIVHDPFDDNNLYRSKIPNNVWGPPHEQPRYWDPYTE